jgi:hypothetical protein
MPPDEIFTGYFASWSVHFINIGCPLVPEFAGSNPAETNGFFGRKYPHHAFIRKGSTAVCSMPHIRGMLSWVTGKINRPFLDRYFHLSILGALALLGTWWHPVANVGTPKGRGNQWQTTPKKLPITQRTTAIPVSWMDSSSCQTAE